MLDKQKQLEKRKVYRDLNKERINSLKREHYKRNKDTQKKYYKQYLYGISEEEYIQLFIKQEGKCAICRLEETVVQKSTNLIRELSVDHCHNSNKVRGLLCTKCNVALGMFKDSIDNLQQALDYLKGNQLQDIVEWN